MFHLPADLLEKEESSYLTHIIPQIGLVFDHRFELRRELGNHPEYLSQFDELMKQIAN
jgi:hypothetical protein